MGLHLCANTHMHKHILSHTFTHTPVSEYMYAHTWVLCSHQADVPHLSSSLERLKARLIGWKGYPSC